MNLWFLTRSIELYSITIDFLNLKCHSHNVDLVYWKFYEFLCRVLFLSLNSYLDNQTFLIGLRRCYHNRSTRNVKFFPVGFQFCLTIQHRSSILMIEMIEMTLQKFSLKAFFPRILLIGDLSLVCRQFLFPKY